MRQIRNILLLFSFALQMAPAQAQIRQARLDEPLEKRILTPVDPKKFPAGLCPGNPATSLPSAPRPEKEELGVRVARDARNFSAALAAKAVYALADLESNTSGESFVSGMRDFLDQIPAGYDLYFMHAEPNAGLKYMILRPSDTRPWILAIAGTQSTLDWIMDLDLGGSQLSRLSRLLAMFTTCQYQDGSGQPLASRPWLITGHSLGGGVAQALAYEIQRRRFAADLNPVDMHLVTFNAFGAQPLVEREAPLDSSIVPWMQPVNFFVLGDEVSRIGKHLGQTKQLTPAEADLSVVRRHAMETVLEIARKDRLLLSGLASAETRLPPERKTLRALLPLARVLSRLATAAYDETNEERILTRLTDDVAAVVQLDLSDPVNARILDYTRRLVFSREMEWESSSNGVMRRSRLGVIRRLRQQLQQADLR